MKSDMETHMETHMESDMESDMETHMETRMERRRCGTLAVISALVVFVALTIGRQRRHRP